MHIDSFKEHFKAIADQRQSAKVSYPLFDVLFGSLCPVIAGAKGWFDIREYIQGHHNWFQNNGMFIDGIPVDDTIARIIATIEPAQFHGVVDQIIRWNATAPRLSAALRDCLANRHTKSYDFV